MELKSGGMLFSEVFQSLEILRANMSRDDVEDDIDMRIIRENRGDGHPHRRRKACVAAKGDVNRRAGALGVLCRGEFVSYRHSDDSGAVASSSLSVPGCREGVGIAASGDHD